MYKTLTSDQVSMSTHTYSPKPTEEDLVETIFIRSAKYMHNRHTVSQASHYCFMRHHTTDTGGIKTEYGINKIVW